MQIVTALAL